MATHAKPGLNARTKSAFFRGSKNPCLASKLSPAGAVRHGLLMKPSLTDTLCTRCGMCCDGSLFADVELANATEATALEVMGLEIEDDDESGGLLLQPCGALRGKRCSIYAYRPECCRTFECRLLQNVRLGTTTLDRAGEQIAETMRRIMLARKLAAELGQRDTRLPLMELCTEALTLADEAAANPALNRKRARLEVEMKAVERLIRKWFLGVEERH
ncbi:MAG: YkgJ family cysteine cluster protein [Pedosphaera sp.]|nr:YkgJ family cysteine cluster protein [Pedosphaera sp.]